jgi:L-threonylcarbamoyladenylate synthase
MKKLLSKQEFLVNKSFFIHEIIAGKVFIYPTDTLYGFGANALLQQPIKRIMEIKKRESKKPFLVIAPSFEWIFENCVIENKTVKENLLQKLPGPYSFVLKLKNNAAVSPLVCQNPASIGIRLPNHWFSKIISESRTPFISTSVNFNGFPSAKNACEISMELMNLADYIITDDESVSGKASTIIDFTTGKEIILRN